MIRGSLRDFPAKSPRVNDLRQTPYSVRKKIMSFLGPLVHGANILDLFAGSGSLGLDAVKNGATRATFVDLHEECTKAIRSSIKLLNLEGRCRVYNGSANAFVEKSSQDEFDIIFFTPPYLNLHLYLIQKIRRIIKDGGLLVFEHPPTLTIAKLEKEAVHFEVKESSNFGWSRVSFLKPK